MEVSINKEYAKLFHAAFNLDKYLIDVKNYGARLST